MKPLNFARLLVLCIAAVVAGDLPAETPTAETKAPQRFNQVFVKVVHPVTADVPKQKGPVIEAWVAEQLKPFGEAEYFAVTEWMPVSGDWLADNRVWNGHLEGRGGYCPVHGDLPERECGRVLVRVAGWAPVPGFEANITLPDEPGSRAVGAVQYRVGRERKLVQTDTPLPYVAVLIGPPPQERVASPGDEE